MVLQQLKTFHFSTTFPFTCTTLATRQNSDVAVNLDWNSLSVVAIISQSWATHTLPFKSMESLKISIYSKKIDNFMHVIAIQLIKNDSKIINKFTNRHYNLKKVF